MQKVSTKLNSVIRLNCFEIYIYKHAIQYCKIFKRSLLLHGTPCPNSPRTRPMMSQITIYYLFFSDRITLLFLKLTLLAVESFRRLWYPGELGVEWSDRSGRMGTESLPPQSRPPRSEADVPPLGMVGPMVSMLVKLLLRPWKKSTKYIITICFVLCMYC